MPELPEVETVKEGLKENYLNKEISEVIVNHNNIIANVDVNEFKSALIGQKIESFARKGKFIIVNLSNGTMLFHLRMEGKFKFKEELIDKHSHVIFKFKDNSYLIYHDVRKFGRVYYFSKDINIFNVNPLNKLGLEPWDIKDENYLLEKYKKNNNHIKSVLLDQSIIAGIGNIYADEILFASKINPLRKASSITKEEAKLIIASSIEILRNAIKMGGTTIKSFQSQHGVDGMFQINLKMYGKGNTPCSVCSTQIIKTKVNGRGTCYCSNCQK